jgi:hypothetical protein
MLTIHLHLVLRIRMSGAIPVLSLYTFTEQTGTILRFYTRPQSRDKRLLASLCPSVRPSVHLFVRMEALGSQWTDFHEIWHLNIFLKSVEQI